MIIHITSANDVYNLELTSGGTVYAAPVATRAAFTSLIQAGLWMSFKNVVTGVLHWDFVRLTCLLSAP